ncbi:MAG: ion transporter [Lachnospiraceae bacterium]|nr:ion transporter [Lachnospiraceae bacterium]
MFDRFIVLAIALNLASVFFGTFEESAPYKNILTVIETVTVIIFTVEYCLRVWTADLLYPEKTPLKARGAFILSFSGIIDLLSFLPFYLPVMFPMGVVAFRLFRVIRIFRLFRINAQYDAFNVIVNVLKEKKDQLISSMSMILIMMTASSLCMYSLEPENFKNAFAGMWWSVSTLLTVGYGDIYPATDLGKLMAIVISFLGVGMVAIPTGIISAGFVEQYSKAKASDEVEDLKSMDIITSRVNKNSTWVGKKVSSIEFPPGQVLVSVIRDNKLITLTGDDTLKNKDVLVIYKEEPKDL